MSWIIPHRTGAETKSHQLISEGINVKVNPVRMERLCRRKRDFTLRSCRATLGTVPKFR